MSSNTLKVLGVVSLVSMLGFASVAQAGKIISKPTPAAPLTDYFGGWNLDNVQVLTYTNAETPTLTPTDFNEVTGYYDPTYFTFEGLIYNVDDSGATGSNLMGILHGKDMPVGEPSGIKVVNDDPGKITAPKPKNCIVTTSYVDPNFLLTASPEQTICSSGFQTHKRFKVNMMPNSVDTNIPVAERAIDLVFNVESEVLASRDYQVFQKINNYTGKRLDGFRVEVGTGIGANFEKASVVFGAYPQTKLSISAPTTETDPDTGIWASNELATFSRGLFGPLDDNPNHVPPHFEEDGFFDDIRAGFLVTAEQSSGASDFIESYATLGSNYAQVPPGTGPTTQFGPWIHSDIMPDGIFYDDDDDEATDARLMAFWGATDAAETTYAWMRGEKDEFAIVDPTSLAEWDSDPLYEMGEIEDMLNLGLNYIVTIGVVDSSWPGFDEGNPTFTIRMIPIPSTDTSVPGYASNRPSGIIPAEGTVQISPSPEFTVGGLLTMTVADSNATSVSVNVENLTNGDAEDGVVMGAVSSGFYSGTLPTSDDDSDLTINNGVLYVEPGDEVRVTYIDSDPMATVTASTTAIAVTTFFVIPLPNGGASVFDL